jgi:nitrite reductase (NO-forming)
MRFHPARITVPRGDRLVIELTNRDHRRHDSFWPPVPGFRWWGTVVRLDAGVIGGPVDGWCSLPGHRQAGLTLSITDRRTGRDHPRPRRRDRPAPGVDLMAEPDRLRRP